MNNRLASKRRFRSVSIFWLLPNMLQLLGLCQFDCIKVCVRRPMGWSDCVVTVAAVFDIDGRTARIQTQILLEPPLIACLI